MKNVIMTKKDPSCGYAVLMLLTLSALLVVGMTVFNAPLAVIMFLGWLVINLFALKLGYTDEELEKIAQEG